MVDKLQNMILGELSKNEVNKEQSTILFTLTMAGGGRSIFMSRSLPASIMEVI